MTVATKKRMIQHIGNGLTREFPYDFTIPNEEALEVYLTNTTTGLTVQLNPSVFSVTGIGEATFGEVTYPLSGPPIESHQILTIRRTVEYDQNTSIRNQSGFFPDVIEDAFDHLTYQTQQNADNISRAIVIPLEETTDTTLPALLIRSNKLLGFDSAGRPVAISGLNKSSETVTAIGSTIGRMLAERFAETVNLLDFVNLSLPDQSAGFLEAVAVAQARCRNPGSRAAAPFTLRIPAAEYHFSDRLEIVGPEINIDADPGATFIFDSNATGGFLFRANTAANQYLYNMRLRLPQIIRPPNWSDTAIGLQIDNLVGGNIHFQNITGWYEAFQARGNEGRGFVENEIWGGDIINCKRGLNLKMDNDAGGRVGWVNENSWHKFRFILNSGAPGTGTPIPGTVAHEMLWKEEVYEPLGRATSRPNRNRFYDFDYSLSGWEKTVRCEGGNNVWFGTRQEGNRDNTFHFMERSRANVVYEADERRLGGVYLDEGVGNIVHGHRGRLTGRSWSSASGLISARNLRGDSFPSIVARSAGSFLDGGFGIAADGPVWISNATAQSLREEGTAQAGGTATITLRSGALAVDNIYAGFEIRIVSGTGAGQAREIVSYVGATRVATVDDDWTTPPDATSAYEIDTLKQSGGTATAVLADHGYTTGDVLRVWNAVPDGYNAGPYTITVIDSNVFTFPVSAALASPATGTPDSSEEDGESYIPIRVRVGGDAQMIRTGSAGMERPTWIDGSSVAREMLLQETGTWTPVIQGSTTPGVNTYATQSGNYAVFGNMVIAYYRIILSAKGTDGDAMAGNAQIAGLPFPALSTNQTGGQPVRWANIASAAQLGHIANSGQTSGNLFRSEAGAGYSAVTVADIADNTEIQGMMIYRRVA